MKFAAKYDKAAIETPNTLSGTALLICHDSSALRDYPSRLEKTMPEPLAPGSADP